jgi:solute:Na+ symporter, SSS family
VLTTLDIVVIVGWLLFTFAAGLWFARKGSEDTDTFFVTDRSLPWWVVGTSMVATTFAADTPLAVSGYVAAAGIHDNWKWWFVGAGGITATFLFAPLWRRSHVITDAELVELRYGGTAAKALRGTKAIWFGVFMNVLVIGWVMSAMRSIVAVVLALPEDGTTTTLVVFALFVMALIYTGTSGLLGVIATDLVQFVMAMFGAILLAVLAWNAAGGIAGMEASFAQHGFDWDRTTSLFPVNDAAPDGATAKLVMLLGVMWWSSRSIDGGGYISQRLFAAKDDRHASWAMLWHTTALICLRPWPWVVVGLAGMAMLGPLEDPELYYPKMMVAVLPSGLLGLMVASFLAAFMSTIDTQLHWGASLLINDGYRRFINPKAPDAHHLLASRFAVVGLAVLGALVSLYIDSISGAWELAFSVTAGIGTVYAARWYWWRVNAWSEFSALGWAMFTSFGIAMCAAHHPELAEQGVAHWSWLADVPKGWLGFPFGAVVTTLSGIPVWLAVTMLTSPGEPEHLRAFYRRVRPGGPGWRKIAGDIEGFDADGPSIWTFVAVVGGIAGLYGVLIGVGALLLGHALLAITCAGVAIVGGGLAVYQVSREFS